MNNNSYVTEQQAKDFFNNPPDVEITEEQRLWAEKMMDEWLMRIAQNKLYNLFWNIQ